MFVALLAGSSQQQMIAKKSPWMLGNVLKKLLLKKGFNHLWPSHCASLLSKACLQQIAFANLSLGIGVLKLLNARQTKSTDIWDRVVICCFNDFPCQVSATSCAKNQRPLDSASARWRGRVPGQSVCEGECAQRRCLRSCMCEELRHQK